MQAQIVPFPGSEDRIFSRPAGSRAMGRRTYKFADMVRIVGLVHVETRTAIDVLRRMARDDGLPFPITTRSWGGKTYRRCPDAIDKRSLWDAAAVDLWDQDEPVPPASAAAPAVPVVGLHQTMRDRAYGLAGR